MIGMTFSNEGLTLALEQAPAIIGLSLQKWATQALHILQAAVDRNIAKGALIGRRTGNLARSLRTLVTTTPDGLVAELWPDPDKAPYASIQEDGGTIIPRSARALTIPLAAMLTANGVARATAGQVRDNPQAYGYSATFIPKGHAVIMGRILGSGSRPSYLKGATDSIVPLFALAQSVVIPAHRYLALSLIQNWAVLSDLLETITGQDVEVAFTGYGAAA